MKKWKSFVIFGTMAVSLSLLAGCAEKEEADANNSRGKLESERNVSAGDDEKKGDTDVSEKEPGFDSSDDAIVAFWQGIADGSEEELKDCFLGENVLNSKQYELIEEGVDQIVGQVESVHNIITIDVDNISTQKVRIEAEDLPSNIFSVVEVENAVRSTVAVPMTQTIDGDVCEVKDDYEMYTIQVDGRWYIDTQINDLGVRIVNEDGNYVASMNEYEWCTILSGSDYIKCIYANGVNDSFEIADGVTFGDLCDSFEKENADFNRETFRRVFSLDFGDESAFTETQKMGEAYMASVMGSLAELSYRIDKAEGEPLKMELYRTAPYEYIYTVECTNYGTCEFHMDVQTGDLKMIRLSDGNESLEKITDQDVAGWESAARELLGQ